MRGSPPVHLAIMLTAFVLLAVPLLQLTASNPSTKAAQPAEAAASAAVPTTLRVRYAHKPASLSIKLGDKDLLAAADRSANPIEASASLLLPKEGIELNVEATWPAGTQDTALTVELEPEARDSLSQTRWSSGDSLSEIVVFQWKP